VMLTAIVLPWWLEWGPAGLPLIAIITTLIAIEQCRLNRRQYRLALFERWMVVFNKTMNMIASIVNMTDPSREQTRQFIRDTRDHELLFKSEISTLPERRNSHWFGLAALFVTCSVNFGACLRLGWQAFHQ
jgi:hypothetical protein